jgi:redox-sensitive bicupin YhaK (pirin superfamily)
MITLRRGPERHHVRGGKEEIWHTFYRGAEASSRTAGFAALAALDESRLSPGGDITRQPHRELEIVTYVREGALAQEDSTGHSGVVHAGEFQRLTAGPGVRGRERNPSVVDGAHVFQLCLGPLLPGVEPGHEQRRFSTAQRRGGLCVVASPDGRNGSLRGTQDALLYSALLDPGQHVIYELASARSAWLHVVEGEATLDGLVLTSGDGAGLTGERAVSLTAREETEILLVDLGVPPATRRAGAAA